MGIDDLRKHLGGKYDDKIIENILQTPFAGNEQQSFENWRESFVGAFICKNADRTQLLRYFGDTIGKEVPEWSDLTKLNLSKFADYIKENFSPNTSVTYLAIMKAFLNCYSDEEIMPCHDFKKILTGKRAPSQHVALTEEEMIRLDEYEPKSDTERDVKIIFMRGCYSGARGSDGKIFTEDNIVGDRLTYVSKKTLTEVSQPIHARLTKYITQQPKKTHTRAVINRTIQRICKNLGMDDETMLYVRGKMIKGPKYEFITMHSSRRSYVTCLATRDVPVSVISKLAGHSSVNMTSRYICVDTKNLSNEAMAFFNT